MYVASNGGDLCLHLKAFNHGKSGKNISRNVDGSMAKAILGRIKNLLCITTSCEFANNKPKDKEKTWTISTVSEFIKARKRLQYPETSLSSYMLLYIF